MPGAPRTDRGTGSQRLNAIEMGARQTTSIARYLVLVEAHQAGGWLAATYLYPF